MVYLEDGCQLADILKLGEKSLCQDCPFEDCIFPCPTTSPKFIDKAAVTFSFLKPEVTASLFGVSLRTIERRLKCVTM